MPRAIPSSFGPLAALGRVGLVVVIGGLLLGGCTVTSFLGRQYTNFTAYYNKFHNANVAFEEGVASIKERERTIDRTQYVSVFLTPGEQVDESPFDKAIQKSADVLRKHPKSKWVDDALLLIGKSYYYKQNYVGGAQKFREVIALDGERAQEARFWLARTLVATERYEAAAEAIGTGIDGEPDGPWTARLYLVRGQLLTRQGQWGEAVRALNQGLQGDLPESAAARAAFLLGQTLETIGRPTPAQAAYQEVRKYDPFYALGFAARLNEIELQGIHGKTDRALDRLRDLETDEKNYEQRGEMAVVRARIYRARGQDEQARRTLRDMLYQGESLTGGARGRLHYDLARLYRDAFKDFSRAAAHFDTASTALSSNQPSAERDVSQRMPTAPADAGTQADRYRGLADRARTVARLDSLLRLGRMSDEAFQAFVAELRRTAQAEQEANEANRAPGRRLQSRGRDVAEQRQGAAPAADTRTSDAGFLFYKDPARVQRGRRQFEQTWGDRPLVDNWRRQVAIRSTEAASAEANEEGTTGRDSGPSPAPSGTTAPEQSTDQRAGPDLSAVPRDSASLAEMEAKRTVARYKLANSLFLAASRPDSAATWYRRILQESGDHPVAKRALYALAEAYRAQGDSTAAQQAYRRLVDQYPDTDLAVRARERLDRSGRMSIDNRPARADSAYARVYEQWQQEQESTSLSQFLDVAARYPETDAAPRALLAAGIMYWKQVQRDSTEVPRTVLRRYLGRLHMPDSTRSDSTNRWERASAADASGAPSPVADTATSSAATVSDTTTPRADASPGRISSGDSSQPVVRPVDTSRVARGEQASPSSPDSTRVPADTLAADTTQQDTSTAAGASVYAPLNALMRHLTERYPEAPQVTQARSILALIEEQRPAVEERLADTTATDSTATDTTAVDTGTVAAGGRRREAPSSPQSADSTEEQREEKSTTQDDSTPLPAPTGRQTQPDEDADGGIDPKQGGWTLLVQTLTSSQEASTRIAEVGQRLGDQWPVDLLNETREGTTQYRLVVGQFQFREAATEAQKRVAGQLRRRPQVWALSNVEPGS